MAQILSVHSMSLHSLAAKYGAAKAISAVVYSERANDLGVSTEDQKLLDECRKELQLISSVSDISIQNALSAVQKSPSRKL